jgi:hypothetical protein
LCFAHEEMLLYWCGFDSHSQNQVLCCVFFHNVSFVDRFPINNNSLTLLTYLIGSLPTAPVLANLPMDVLPCLPP